MSDNKDFDEILKSFKGYDSEGRLVLGDDETGEFQALDKNDFSKVYDYAKTKVNPNLKFDDSYKDFQAKQTSKQGLTYLGSDSSGQSVFKNQSGIIERANMDFAEGLKRQFGDKAFSKQDQGIKNQVAGENLFKSGNATRQGFGLNSNIASLNQRNLGTASVSNRGFGGFRPNDQGRSEERNVPKVEERSSSSSNQSPNLMKQATNALGQGLQQQIGTQINKQTKSATQPIVQQAKQAIQPYKDKAKQYGQELASKYVSPEMKDMYGQGKGVLNTAQTVQNFLKDPKSAAINYAKDYAMNMAKDKLQQTVLNNLPGGVGTALSAGKLLSGGGNAASKGDAAGRLAAQTALAAATGGLSTVINPETMNMAANLQDKLSAQTDKLGIVGKPLGLASKISSEGLRTGAMVGNEALNLAGKTGADFFGNTNDLFKGSKDIVKNITSGNVGDALKGVGSTALKTIGNTLVKTPVNALKNVASSVGKVISNIFCFHPDTKVIMMDGSIKKISEVKVGDQMMLGGLVTAVGEALNQDLHEYNNVIVSGGHAVLEDGKWIRVKESKLSKKLENKEASVVIPITNENHLIMTEDFQVWADMDEVEDTYNKTDTQIIKEMNSKKLLNKMLQTETDELKYGNK